MVQQKTEDQSQQNLEQDSEGLDEFKVVDGTSTEQLEVEAVTCRRFSRRSSVPVLRPSVSRLQIRAHLPRLQGRRETNCSGRRSESALPAMQEDSAQDDCLFIFTG